MAWKQKNSMSLKTVFTLLRVRDEKDKVLNPRWEANPYPPGKEQTLYPLSIWETCDELGHMNYVHFDTGKIDDYSGGSCILLASALPKASIVMMKKGRW